MNPNIPSQYKWLENEGAPKVLVEALKLVGIREVVGQRHNPIILSWAEELGIRNIYTNDELPWCGLAMGYVALKAGKNIPLKGWDILRALKWAAFGTKVSQAKLGDVLIFQRPGGGHVGIYVGEDDTHYHVLGGNQSNMFGFTRIAKSRLAAIRRPEYNIGVPPNVRRVFLKPTGIVSDNEA